jgi:hypothetical protein
MQFINKELAEDDQALTPVLYNVLMAMNFLMLIGLGSILIFQAMKKNPHFLEYHRLKLKQSRTQKRLSKKEMMFTKSVNQIPLLEFSHDVTKESFEEGEIEEDWQKVNKSDRTDGLSQKAVNAYRRENPGSKLQTAVTEKNPKGKRAARRRSFCSRMSGMKKRLTSSKNARDPDSPINKALRRWNC